ncbi:hypothetical protein ACFE04_008456 [Oxalis oulophora]
MHDASKSSFPNPSSHMSCLAINIIPFIPWALLVPPITSINFDLKLPPFQVYRTDQRGGEVTYHGPGQMDLHWYLEELVIRVLASTFSIKASRLQSLTGVWFGDRKLAAIGIRFHVAYKTVRSEVLRVYLRSSNRPQGMESRIDLHELDDQQPLMPL